MATSRIREVQEQLLAVRNRKLALGDDIRTMAPKEHLSPEAEARFDRKIETYKKLEVEEIDLDRELVGLVRTDKSLTLEPGDQSSGSPQFMRSGPDPWTETRGPLDGIGDIRSRALRANERVEGEHIADEDRARVERMIRSDDSGSNAEYITAVSDPEYKKAFLKVLRDPQRGHIGFTSEEARSYARAEEQRTALNLSGAAALLPYYLDPAIILTNTGSVGNFRDFCRTETIGAQIWHGVTSAGISAEFPGEATESTDGTPTVSAATVSTYRMSAYAQISYEVWQDSNFAAQLPMLFADAQRRGRSDRVLDGFRQQPTDRRRHHVVWGDRIANPVHN